MIVRRVIFIDISNYRLTIDKKRYVKSNHNYLVALSQVARDLKIPSIAADVYPLAIS